MIRHYGRSLLIPAAVLAAGLFFIPSLAGAATQQQIDDARAKGLAWLMSHQQGDGSWRTAPGTDVATTATAVGALGKAGTTGYSYAAGVAWLSNTTIASVDSLARAAVALATTVDITPAVQRLVGWRNGNLAWGAYDRFGTSFPDTSLALEAIRASAIAYADQDLQTGLCAILNAQDGSGAWSYTAAAASAVPTVASWVAPTAHNILEINGIAVAKGWSSVSCSATTLTTAINNGISWLLTQRNTTDGGFGAQQVSTVFETALAYRVLSVLRPTDSTTGGALDYLINTQGSDGSWNGDAFDTATALVSLPAPVTALTDSDGDGIPDTVEPLLGTNPIVFDSRFLASGNGLYILTALTPATATAGTTGFTLTVNGTNFTAASVVRWNGADRTTTFVSATMLQAAIPATDIAVGGVASVTVFTPAPGGGATAPLSFTVVNPPPVLSSLTPANTMAGGAGFSLALTGDKFVPSSQARWNDAARATTYVSATQLTATIPASDIATAGTASITVFNPAPAGGVSGAQIFTINNPEPTLSALSPASTTAGGPQLTLTLTGTNFVASSVVRWNGADRVTTYISATQLQATIPSSDIATAGTVSVTVFTPAPGGGTSAAQPFTVNNPEPTLSALSPTSTTAGGPQLTLTLTGTNFVAASVVQWNGAARTTTYVSATQLTATIAASDIAAGATPSVTVFNPTPGGGTSTAQTFTINNPVPTLDMLSPTNTTVGGPQFTLTLSGNNFVTTAVVQWNGAARATTYVSATQLTATIPAGDIATAGTASVTVFNPTPAGGTSAAQTFTVNNPAPTLSSLSPTSTTAGGPQLTLTLTGTNFVAASVVRWNGADRVTTYISATQLQATIPASDIAAGSTPAVTVFNPTPGGGISAAQTFTVENPAPILETLNPTNLIAGGSEFVLTVTGTNFVTSSVVQWNGVARATTFVSSAQLTATIPAGDIATAGTVPVTVFNPAPAGGTSAAQTFTVNNPAPTLSALSPASATTGGSEFTLTVTGTNFVASSVVQWNGSTRTTTYVSATQLTATIPAIDIAVGGTSSVTVVNPTPGGGTSAAQVFTVNNPVPSLGSLNPTSVVSGGTQFTLTVTGSNFVTTSVVQWNGAPRSTTFVSATQLTATIPAGDIATAGTASVTVFNPTPAGGTSNPQTFTINSPAPTLSSLSPTSTTAGGPQFTLTVTGTNFVASSVVQWNGADRVTTYLSTTQLEATIPATDTAIAGTVNVTVSTPAPGGGTSATQVFTVNNPAPTLSSLSPTSTTAGGPQFTLTVTGANFVAASMVRWNGADRVTTYISATQLQATIPASDIAAGSTPVLTVFNPTPGGGTSAPQTFTVNNPVPTLSSLSPTSTAAGGPEFTLSVTGTNFVTSSVVQWNGSARATTYVSATELQATIAAGDITAVGTASVTVFNPPPTGGTSAVLSFAIINPLPVGTSLFPASMVVNGSLGADFTLIVYGTGFISSSQVLWNGTTRATTFVSATELQATIQGAAINTAGTADVTVSNPAPGGGTSGPLTFTIANPTPSVTSISPAYRTAGTPGFSLDVFGSRFTASSVVRWNGQSRTTSVTNSTHLVAMIPASDIATVGTATIDVSTPGPGGGTSTAFPFAIISPAASGNGLIIDNGQPGTSFTGTWTLTVPSGSAGNTVPPYGADWLTTPASPTPGTATATYRWTPTIAEGGSYNVYMWWPNDPSRSTAKITVTDTSGAQTFTRSQQTGAQWTQLGITSFHFNPGTAGYVEISNAAGAVAADAVKFLTTAIDGDWLSISRVGSGSGRVTASPGGIDCGTACADIYIDNTTITLTATPDPGSTFVGWGGDNACSTGQFVIHGTVSCTANFNASTGVTIDNDQAGTSFTGTWNLMATQPESYGPDFRASGDSAPAATYRWTPTIPTSGSYHVYIWWTATPLRSATVPLSVVDDAGAHQFFLNQRSGGGQWQLLGTFTFSAGTAGYVELSTANGQAAADAVRFVPVGP